jgi:glycolate oxidase iron-sulfur subunit
MQTQLPEHLLATDRGQRADAILRSCVHCGFCNATCPTYQLLGDELDGPRGRIYLIKDFLETQAQSPRLQQHLDRCLTCRACETTCPSGVQYGELLEIARSAMSDDRTVWDRLVIAGLKYFVPNRIRFRVVVQLGNLFRRWLPRQLRQKVPPLGMKAEKVTPNSHARKIVLLGGCVQSVSTPEVNQALRQLLETRHIECVELAGEGCCGSLALHLGDEKAAIKAMAANVETLGPVAAGAEAIISTASGCGVTLKDYGRHLAATPLASKAACFSDKTMDVAEYLANSGITFSAAMPGKRIAWHSPCSLQHGQRVRDAVEKILKATGYVLTEVPDPHLCCGSAGTYSVLQGNIANELRERKLGALGSDCPDLIATANVGCQLHLASAADVPVVHWLQLLR